LNPLIGLLVSINSICGSFFLLYPLKLFFIIQNILFLLDLLFWYIFFFILLTDKKTRDILFYLFLITLFIALYMLFFSKADKNNLHIVALGSICKSVYCIIFFYKLFKNLFYQRILKEPAFWIVSGLIFYSSLSLPFYTLHSYLKSKFSLLISYNIFSISNMLIIIMHLFFIKAYLCTIRVYKV
jgi:hypothetical protein